MLNTVDGPTDVVEDYLCDPEEIPAGTRESRLPCPDQCVLSEWSSWTNCQLVREETPPISVCNASTVAVHTGMSTDTTPFFLMKGRGGAKLLNCI